MLKVMWAKGLVFLFSWLVSVVGVLLSVLFMTLWERKMLSYVALRKGPNKVSFLGYVQAVGDAVKLFGKEMNHPWVSSIFLYWFSPVLFILVLIGCWFFIYFMGSVIMFSLSVLGFLSVSALSMYVLLGSGWGSKAKYTILGCLRGACQNISYEVSLIFLILVPFIILGSYNYSWVVTEKVFFTGLGSFGLFLVWFIICMCETKRSPFDFAEGESELVSGFKVEYGALQFALLYLGEYGSMVFLSYVSSSCFFSGVWPFGLLGLLGFIGAYMWVRGTLPRFRYDLLMELSWMVFLPMSMLWLFFMML